MRTTPLWSWVCCGFLLAGLVLDRGDRGRAARHDAWALRWNPETMNARELRLLPGIGARRARDVVRLRHERRAAGRGLEWEEVSGIGPRTGARVRAWLAERGVQRPAEVLAGETRPGSERKAFPRFHLPFPITMEAFPPLPSSLCLPR